ncbi:MurR/RpiR family transcriptional regulator [Candidatus Enterococcus ferrettii]|uniref:RpiR family transcriptional regulator, glv operon transcriptional regulator n=1 Tax=Candidatus Enterococcus ferrettii TaxID=2815324 RepID=A0ABV0EMD8_9ENTE|nr:MurR/RpiR family transcriptional regulator [Enterococcus sp. 665A]MBO1339771.1 MurR/RpiR family transcriptional regulator [Enterococcus sp. 665A]
MDLAGIAQQHQRELGELDKEIIGFILDNQAATEHMNIIELADAVHTSKSTILRLTKKLGFTGFSEFKYFLKQNRVSDSYKGPNVDSVATQISDITRTLDYLKSQDMTKLLQKMDDSETIYCYGTGYSQRKVIEEFSKLMICVEKRVIILPNKTEFDISMPMIKKTDLVIFASLSGETDDVKENLDILAMRGITTAAITSFGDNYFSRKADYSLFYYATPIIVGRKSFISESLIGLSCAMDYLFRKYGEFTKHADQKNESTKQHET